MRIRDLRHGLLAAWPPRPSRSAPRASSVDDHARFVGVTILQHNGGLLLELEDARGTHANAVVRWDRPPSPRWIADVLLPCLGTPVASLGDLEIPGFYGSDLRQRARQLVEDRHATGGEWFALFSSRAGVGPLVPSTVIATVPDALCDLCDDYGPKVTYHQRGGWVLRLHAACQAICLEEHDRLR